MPRDKKTIHRATSDVEDSDTEEVDVVSAGFSSKQNELKSLIEERKRYLKDIILKRNIALKQQREREKNHKVNSTK